MARDSYFIELSPFTEQSLMANVTRLRHVNYEPLRSRSPERVGTKDTLVVCVALLSFVETI